MAEYKGRTGFAVYRNLGEPYVMAYFCWCGLLAVAFSSEPHGMFTGACAAGHEVTVLAS